MSADMSWWASSSAEITSQCGLCVLCRVQSAGPLTTFVVIVGSQVVRRGVRCTKRQAWRSINRCLEKITEHGEQIVGFDD